jgi:hypothetical protein
VQNAARAVANAALIATMPAGTNKHDVLRGSIGSWALGTTALAKTTLQDLLNQNPQYVQFDVIADGVTKFSKTITASATFRLADGFRSDNQEFNIVSNVRVRSVKIGMGPKDLTQA